jgi:hypothetical protein
MYIWTRPEGRHSIHEKQGSGRLVSKSTHQGAGFSKDVFDCVTVMMNMIELRK